MRFVKVIITTAIVLLGIVFIIENLEMLKTAVKIKLDLYVVYLESPDIHLWVIILFCVFLGVFIASLYGIYEIIDAAQDHPATQAQPRYPGPGTQVSRRRRRIRQFHGILVSPPRRIVVVRHFGEVPRETAGEPKAAKDLQ